MARVGLQSMEDLIVLRPDSLDDRKVHKATVPTVHSAARYQFCPSLQTQLMRSAVNWSGQKRMEKKKGAKRHVGKIKLTRKGKKGNTLDCGHLNVEYFLVHKNLADSSLPYVTSLRTVCLCCGRGTVSSVLRLHLPFLRLP